jgi:DNA-binding transcriptional LysR family regulator
VKIAELEAPGISLRVLPLTTRDPRRMLEHEEADMAIGYFPAVIASLAARSQSGVGFPFETQRLYVGQYVCVMRHDHPLAHAPLTLDAYCAARHQLVSFSGRPYGFIDQTLGALGRERRIAVTVNQFFTAGRVVANSNLLTVLPRHFVNVTGVDDRLVMRDLPFDQPLVHVDAVWHRRAQHGHAHEWLREALLRSAASAFAGSLLTQALPAG